MGEVKIAIDKIEKGMRVAEDVYFNYFDENILLASKNTLITDRGITRLKFYGIQEIVILKEGSEANEEHDYFVRLKESKEFKAFDNNYLESAKNIKCYMNQIIEKNIPIDTVILLKDIQKVLQVSHNGIQVFDMLQCMKHYDDLTYVHSMNVALICHVIGKWLKLKQDQINALSLSGLMHDVGKLVVPKEIIKKPSKLTDEEYELIKQHCEAGYQLLKDQDIDECIKYSALMHHEKNDGSGYPCGLLGDQIEPFAKIVAIADVYDAMTSSRVYRGAICPFHVIESFEKEGLHKYDPVYLLPFLEGVVQSYINNRVRLSNKQEGRIIMINKTNLSRPIVQVGNKFIDLSKESDLSIEAIL